MCDSRIDYRNDLEMSKIFNFSKIYWIYSTAYSVQVIRTFMINLYDLENLYDL